MSFGGLMNSKLNGDTSKETWWVFMLSVRTSWYLKNLQIKIYIDNTSIRKWNHDMRISFTGKCKIFQ